jgi:hypothetical protein
MRPVTIRKPLSSLRSARNLREVYDVLRLQAGLPARSPVPPALQFLHRPKPKLSPLKLRSARAGKGPAMKELTKLDQHALELVVDAVTAAVAEVFRDRLDELHAKIAHVQLEVSQVVKRGLAPERPSATTLPFGKAQNALPRRQLTEVPKIVLPEQRRARGGDLIRR